MGLLFLSYQGGDLVPMVEEVTQGMNDLCFLQVQGFGNLGNRLTAR